GGRVVVGADPAGRRATPVAGAVGPRALVAPPRLAADAAPAAGWLRSVLRGAPPDDPSADPGGESPLAAADQVVVAAYGVGTAQAATLTLLAAPRGVAGATRIAGGAHALGPPGGIEQAPERGAPAPPRGGGA